MDINVPVSQSFTRLEIFASDEFKKNRPKKKKAYQVPCPSCMPLKLHGDNDLKPRVYLSLDSFALATPIAQLTPYRDTKHAHA